MADLPHCTTKCTHVIHFTTINNLLCNCVTVLQLFAVVDISQSELHQPPAVLCHVQLQGNVRTSQGHVIVSSPWFHVGTSCSKHTTDIISQVKLVQMDSWHWQQLSKINH